MFGAWVGNWIARSKPGSIPAAVLLTGLLTVGVAAVYAPASYSQHFPARHRQLHAQAELFQARSLQEQDAHEAALALLRGALRATRMSRGLYHEDQLDILHSLIESESAQANWEQVDDYFALLRNLYRHLYADEPGRLEAGLARVTDWHVDALRFGLDDRPVPHLREARRLFRARLQLAEGASSPDPGKIERLRRNIHIAETRLNLLALGGNGALREQQALQRELLLSSLP